jgi:hypothetical protein
MKRLNFTVKVLLVFTATAFLPASLLTLASCANAKNIQAAQGIASSAAVSVQAEKSALDQRVLDWQNRGLGEVASPPWLLSAFRGDWRLFKETWPVSPDKTLFVGTARNVRQNVAMTVADVQMAARLGSRLQQSLLSRAGISMADDGEFSAVNDAATKTQVTLTGLERLTDFWQLVETTDSNKKKTQVYQYYVVYAIDNGILEQLVAKYVFDVVGQLPQDKTKQTIAGMFQEIDYDITMERIKSEVDFTLEVAARANALSNPLSPAEQRAAYRSGDQARIAAANTTGDDTDYVAALALIAQGN